MRIKFLIIAGGLITLPLFSSLSRAAIIEPRVMSIYRATSSIQMDGILDEIDWLRAEVSTDFWQRYPYDSAHASLVTEARITYDDKFLYVGAVCQTANEKEYVINSLRRDFRGSGNDAFYFN